ncbi:MAG: tetratricopeptide repeat protein [Sphingobacteriales bacterium]|nr:MAG: tetratricopeptide repeat protein [Sphingobacteriales bacterium]
MRFAPGTFLNVYLKQHKVHRNDCGVFSFDAMRLLLLCILLTVIGACGNNERDALLDNPPYAALTDSIRRAPRNADLYYQRGQLLFGNNEFAAAKRDLRSAWTLQPREDIALSLATALRHESNDSAFAFLQSARKKLPQSIALAIGLARGYQDKGQRDAALEICANILTVFPNQLDALQLQADLFEESGRDADALKSLQTAYGYAPFDVELVHRLCFAYAQAGDARVLPITDSLMTLDKQGVHPEPYYFRGVYYEQKGNSTEAIRWLDEAIRHDYNYLDAHMEKGVVQYDQKRYNDALKTFQLALTITPTYADGYYWVGKCLEAQGNKEDARTNYQRAYGLDKTNKQAKEAAERLK